jgi:hypothetical protein
MSERSWYVLVHEIPARPPYLRAKIRKKLHGLGAVALKDSVYVLPAREDLLPGLTGIAREAKAAGAEAAVMTAQFVEATKESVEGTFRRHRAEDYAALLEVLRAAATKGKRRSASQPSVAQAAAALARARKRFAFIESIDFFGAPGRDEAARALDDLERVVTSAAPTNAVDPSLVGRVWVTRRGIQVDRIASAWFIRRFIDPNARIRFIDPAAPAVRAGEITFDMQDADFTHEEDRCTFETLIYRLHLHDTALSRVAEIVHEIDIKDEKYSCVETGGVRQLLAGMLMANPSDEDRLDRGFALFDDLYQAFHRRLPPTSASASRRAPQR